MSSKHSAYTSCVACSGELEMYAVSAYNPIYFVEECENCGGIHFTGSRDIAFRLILTGGEGDDDLEDLTYFDCRDPEGAWRTHGWFNKETGQVSQWR